MDKLCDHGWQDISRHQAVAAVWPQARYTPLALLSSANAVPSLFVDAWQCICQCTVHGFQGCAVAVGHWVVNGMLTGLCAAVQQRLADKYNRHHLSQAKR